MNLLVAPMDRLRNRFSSGWKSSSFGVITATGAIRPDCAPKNLPTRWVSKEITVRAAAMHADGNHKAFPLFLLAALSSLAGLAGCSSSQEKLSPASTSSHPIKHIVVIMQENRTFDNFFHGFPGADSAQSGMNTI
jgi:phospholipase C